MKSQIERLLQLYHVSIFITFEFLLGYPLGYPASAPGKALIRSTGLYAAAGDVIRVSVSQEFLDRIVGVAENKRPVVSVINYAIIVYK